MVSYRILLGGGEGDTVEVLGGADAEGSCASFVTVFDITWVQISEGD